MTNVNMAGWCGGELPTNLTVSKGQEISGMQFLQYPRLSAFYRDHKPHFVVADIARDAVVYNGPDAEIP